MLTFREAESLHALYNELVGTMGVPWTMQRLLAWECFGLQFTAEDLKLVVAFIKRRQVAKRPCRSLNFRSLISGPNALDWFAEDLSEARTEQLVRNKIREQQGPIARNHALLSIGRPMPEPDRVKSAEDIMRGNEAFKQFLEMKKNL